MSKTKIACRCGATQGHEVPIHEGQSKRLDCAKCGRFVAFIEWYGKAIDVPCTWGGDELGNPHTPRTVGSS